MKKRMMQETKKVIAVKNGQKQRIEIPVYLKGKQIYKAVVEEGKVVMSQTGMNPFAMA